jgi:hypothetical protein
MEPSPQQPQRKNEVEEVGNIFGIVVIVVLLVAGGIYFIYTQYQKTIENQQQLQEQSQS